MPSRSAVNVCLWLQADIQPPEIEVCSTPNNGHFEAHAGLPVLTHSGSRGSPIRDTLYRRLQPFRHLHDCSGCFRLERWPGGTCTHWKSAALPRRTPGADIRLVAAISLVRPRRSPARFRRRAESCGPSLHPVPSTLTGLQCRRRHQDLAYTSGTAQSHRETWRWR